MLTHRQVEYLNGYWKQNFKHLPIPRIVKARNVNDSTRCAIHLLNPTRRELIGTLFEAIYHEIGEIVIHTKHTFGKNRK